MQSSERAPGTGPASVRVATVVLNWNGWHDTVACLESLRALDEVPRVIVVDNGSTDDSPDRIRAAAPWVRLVQLPSNRGFGGGMNAGISAALGEQPAVDYVWLLNNDTLAEPSTLSRMVALAESDSRIGIVGSRLVDADGSGRIQATGGGTINRWFGTTSTRLRPSSKACEHLVGASLLVRRSLLRQIGGFDERYFFYLEDTDLSLRARGAGWRLAVAHDAKVVHRLGASINAGSALRSLRSDVIFARSSGIFVSSLGLPWRITAIPLRLAGMLVSRSARAQADRLLPITGAYLEGLRIGRRSPEVPRFGTGESQRPAGPTRPAPAEATPGRSSKGSSGVTQVGHGEDPGSSRWVSVVRIVAAIGLVAVVGTATIADYVSSWFSQVGGFPAGAILRDAVAASFVCLAGAVLLRERSGGSRASLAPGRLHAAARLAFVPFAALAAWVLVLLLPIPATVPAILAAKNLLLYAAVGFAAYVLIARKSLSTGALLGTLTSVGFATAFLGILDAATCGGVVTGLGYRRDYSGIEGSASRLVAGASAAFQGYVRASGGISNALVFGYLMAAIAVFATWMFERSVIRSGWRSRAALVHVALGPVAGLACIDSLTRGAMIALGFGLFLLVVLRRSRAILAGAIFTVVVTAFLAWAGSGSPSSQSSGWLRILGMRIMSSDATSQESSSLRLGQLHEGLQSLAKRPMGRGLGTEGSASTRSGLAPADLAPDIFVLIVALQTGIIGAGLYGLIFAAMILWAVRGPTHSRALVLAMIGIFAISSVLSASPEAPVFATTIWILLLAVSAIPAETARERPVPSPPQPGRLPAKS